ncbi:MAG: HDIG domain-containing protein [Synergistaceae bacterium]|nr:HDIG domain-containing protein [Synergistaceae bacterium]
MTLTREQALELLACHNDDEGHIRHGLAVEAAMRHFASLYGGDADDWGLAGLLHDLDWEKTESDPASHGTLSAAILDEAGAPAWLSRAVKAHAADMSGVQPETDLEKVLFTVDEMTGFVTAVALVRPGKSLQDLTVKSVKKKWKDKAFARGVDRAIVARGAEMLGKPLEWVMEETIEALRPVEREIGLGEGD